MRELRVGGSRPLLLVFLSMVIAGTAVMTRAGGLPEMFASQHSHPLQMLKTRLWLPDDLSPAAEHMADLEARGDVAAPLLVCAGREEMVERPETEVRDVFADRTRACWIEEARAHGEEALPLPVEARIAPDVLFNVEDWLRADDWRMPTHIANTPKQTRGERRNNDRDVGAASAATNSPPREPLRGLRVHSVRSGPGASERTHVFMRDLAQSTTRQLHELQLLHEHMYALRVHSDIEQSGVAATATAAHAQDPDAIHTSAHVSVFVDALNVLKETAAAAAHTGGVCNFQDVELADLRNGGVSVRFRVSTFSAGVAPLARPAPDHASACTLFLVSAFARQSHVLIVEAEPRFRAHNYRRGYTQGGTSGTETFWNAGITGKGYFVGCADTGVATSSCYFSNDTGSEITPSPSASPITDYSQRKVVQYIAYVDDTDEEDGHGSHVAGTILGKTAVGFTEDDGQAVESRLAFFDIGDSSTGGLSVPSDFDDIFDPANDAGARVHSNSWGASSPEYTSWDADVDEYMYNHPHFLILFAAGNCGEYDANACPTYYGNYSVGTPAANKNGIAVGATESGPDTRYDTANTDSIAYMASFSSQGPSVDGRILPAISAPGYYTWSAWSDSTCGILALAGTSMATPLVAGSAVLIQQYYDEGFYPDGVQNTADGFFPTASLVKATIINCGTPMTAYAATTGNVPLGATPDTYQGWGRLYMSSCLPLADNFDSYAVNADSVVEGESRSYLFEMTSLARNMSVTMCYTDKKGSWSSGTILKHDLDLTVVVNGVTTYYPRLEGGETGPDHINVCEKIILDPNKDDLAVGDEVNVTVHGYLVYRSPYYQNYSVQASGHFNVLTLVDDDDNASGGTSQAPTRIPTAKPSTPVPTPAPTNVPSAAPTQLPTLQPTQAQTSPGSGGGLTTAPSAQPSPLPATAAPSLHPSAAPTMQSSEGPTAAPSPAPTMAPSLAPSAAGERLGAIDFAVELDGVSLSEALDDEFQYSARITVASTGGNLSVDAVSVSSVIETVRRLTSLEGFEQHTQQKDGRFLGAGDAVVMEFAIESQAQDADSTMDLLESSVEEDSDDPSSFVSVLNTNLQNVTSANGSSFSAVQGAKVEELDFALFTGAPTPAPGTDDDGQADDGDDNGGGLLTGGVLTYGIAAAVVIALIGIPVALFKYYRHVQRSRRGTELKDEELFGDMPLRPSEGTKWSARYPAHSTNPQSVSLEMGGATQQQPPGPAGPQVGGWRGTGPAYT